MNMNQIINMLMRLVTSRLLRWGSRKLAAPKAGVKQSPQQRKLDKTARETAKRARQAARITRRMK